MTEHKAVTVVIPVYADWPSLSECLESLKKFLDSKHTVLIVNDSGPEANELEKNIKNAIKNHPNYHYHRNQYNLGFVRTCNKAVLELDKTSNDILLLNSDTEVTEGFLEEMTSVLYVSEKIAAVSPRTNNATIATIPLSSIKQKGIEARQSYALFQKMKKTLPRYNEVPTAHGFCLLIRRCVIKKHGLFDEIFGMGYGEEVDFCQRLKKLGFISVLSNRSYVFHLEARSFSLAKKAEILKKSNQIIRFRYPHYQQEVRDYIVEALWREEGIGSTQPSGRHKLKAIAHKIRDRLRSP